MKNISILFSLVLLFFGISACSPFEQNTQSYVAPKSNDTENISLAQSNSYTQKDSSKANDVEPSDKSQSLRTNSEGSIEDSIASIAMKALKALKDRDMDKLSEMAYPDKGVRFSPYGHINTSTDLVFTGEQLKNMASEKKVYTWGSFDGSGAPIELTFGDYYKKFIYDQDFINAKEVGYNKILGKGNIQNNEFDVYPQSTIVEYYLPGVDPQYNGMDWRSLRLVFEKEDMTWYLVGIIHDQWTI